VGELARDSETRDFQDRPWVDPAGAGRKNVCLSREVCFPARGLATLAAMCGDGEQKSAEAIVGRKSEGLNNEIQGIAGTFAAAVKQNTRKLASGYE
jgi:hypothetical protein